jgi:phosphoribosylformimino-5-aminoimidazole carboxamide ribotide isomerase
VIVIPAVDIRDGACVQLVGGDFERERVRLADPVAVALDWVAAGFRTLHVVDLDAAMGTGSNAGVVSEILACVEADIQVGGGVRSSERIAELFDHGACRVVVGTRALEDLPWLDLEARRFPDRIVVAADVKGRNVCVRGWTETLGRDVVDVVRSLNGLPLAGLLVTAVDVEGRMEGPALSVTRDVVAATTHRVIASGGIAGVGDLRALERAGARAAVVGMALYTKTIDARTVAREFAA